MQTGYINQIKKIPFEYTKLIIMPTTKEKLMTFDKKS